MNESVTEMPPRQDDLQAAAWLFEQLAVDAGESADRAGIRRELKEAAGTCNSSLEDSWWRWLLEASRGLGRKCKVVDCTAGEIAGMAREGALIVTRVGEDRLWIAVAATRGKKFHLLRPQHGQNRIWVRMRQLRSLLGVSGGDQLVRCLVMEPQLATPGHDAAEPREWTPVQRLFALLRPESSDIWILLIFALITGVLALAIPLAVETLVNTVAFGSMLQPLVVLALVLFVILSFSSALRGLQIYVVEIIQRRLFARVAADLAYRLPRVEVTALDGRSGRELVNRFFDVVTVQKVSAQLLLDGISLVLGGLIGMTVLAFYHPWLLGYDIFLVVLLPFAIFVLGRGAVYTSIKESKTKYRMAAWLEDLVGSPMAFRYGGAAEFALERADRLTYDYLNARKTHFRVLMRQIVFALALQAVASTVLLGLGGWLVISGQLTLGQLVAAELIVTVIVGSVAKFGKHMESYYDLLASIDKLCALFDLPMERQQGILQMATDGPASVVVSGVGYAAAPGRPKLDNVNLRLSSGERLILFGKQDAGESILLDLLFGSRKPLSGHITVNGINPQDFRPDTLRKSVVLVRNVEIFAGSVAENVHLERPDVSAGDVREALEEVGLLEQMLRLPDGLETQLVETGHPLTPNQARKLMLARAIAGRPSLLLVDGLLDALPDEDLAHLTQFLVDARRPWTLIIVTGRRAIADAGTAVHRLRCAEPAEL